jgi:hypothetical protein
MGLTSVSHERMGWHEVGVQRMPLTPRSSPCVDFPKYDWRRMESWEQGKVVSGQKMLK